jgi:hypothetical protein
MNDPTIERLGDGEPCGHCGTYSYLIEDSTPVRPIRKIVPCCTTVAATLNDMIDTPTPTTCGHPNPADPTTLCADAPHHYGVHDNRNTWWTNDTYPAAAGPCGTNWCILYNQHPGPHTAGTRR